MRHSLPPESVDARIAARAARQHGVFAFADAMEGGASPDLIARRIAAGRWIRIYPRVYCLAGVPGTWKGGLLAACLTRSRTAASHRAAAALHALAGFPEGTIEVVGPRGSRLRASDVIVHQARDLVAADRTVVDAIPVTSVARTLIDLAGLVATGEVLAEKVAVAFDDALRHRKASVKWVEARLRHLRGRGRAGVAFIEELLAARRGVTVPESVFETRALHMLEKAGFPRPVCQYEIYDGDLFVARVDFAYPQLKLAIEADGFASHSTPADLERDGARSNALQSLGWDVLRLTWSNLERPEQFLRSLGRYLRAG